MVRPIVNPRGFPCSGLVRVEGLCYAGVCGVKVEGLDVVAVQSHQMQFSDES